MFLLNEKQKIAVVSAQGIGDGLIMHVVSHHLAKLGRTIVTFNDHLMGFGNWLPNSRLEKQPSSAEQLLPYDAVILQHDNSPKAKAICRLPSVFNFYGSHSPQKHGPLTARDFVCDPNQTMLANIAQALIQWTGTSSQETGLTPLSHLIHKKHPLRIAIHPSSASPEKNWPLKKFVKVSHILQSQGLTPVFLANDEKPLCPTLESLASFIYESGAFLGNDSGPGHIASALDIPSVIIGPSRKQMRLWAPGWRPAVVVTPPQWSARWRWTRNNWKYFISINRIINALNHSNLHN